MKEDGQRSQPETATEVPRIPTRQGERRAYRALLEQTNDAVFLHDSRGKLLDLNAAALRLLCRPRHDALALPPYGWLAAPSDGELHRALPSEPEDSGELHEPAPVVLALARPSRVPLEVRGSVVRVAAAPALFQTVLGPRETVEGASDDDVAPGLLDEIVNAVPMRLFWKDRDLRYLGCNLAFARDAGLDHPREILGKSDHEMVWQEQAELYRSDDREVIDSGVARHLIEEEQTTPDGRRLQLLTTKVPLRDAGGVIYGVLGCYMDITARIEAEEALRKSEALLNEMGHIARIGGWDMDLETRAGRWTRSTYEIFGVEPAGPIPSFDEHIALYVEEDRPRVVEAMRALVEDDTPLEVEARLRRSEGVRWVRALGRADRSTETFRRVFGTLQDITERKLAEERHAKLEAQLRQAQKMESVGRLAGGVAHDFNNMLGAIFGHVELALEESGDNAALRADLEEIQSAAQRSADLTRQLLAFARQQTVAPRVLDPEATVDGMRSMLGRLIGEDIELRWRSDPPLWPIKIDPSQIDQILVNLCVNARDAISGVGAITIELTNHHLDAGAPGSDATPGDYVKIAVADDGCGMDEATRQRLFEPFFTTKELGRGTGLGLATVYGVVQQNGGFIDVTSQVGEGTTISIYLPRHSEAAKDDDEAANGAVEKGQETILLVEDEPAILRVTQRMLERLGYRVLAASRPAEALALGRDHAGAIDLLVTDVIMPEMNGRDLAKSLLTLRPALRRLFMSGYTAEVIAQHGVLEEGVHFIQKPFKRAELAASIKAALEQA